MEEPQKATTENTVEADDRPTPPKGAVPKRTSVVEGTVEGTVTKAPAKKADADRPMAPKGTKVPAKKAATKAPATAAKKATAKREDRPVMVKAPCSSCGNEAVLEPFEVVAGHSIDLCVVCKTELVERIDALKVEIAAESWPTPS